MAWDATQPTTATKLRLLPAAINPNWVAIQDGTVPCAKWRLDAQAADPAFSTATAQLFSKVAGAETELFAINSAGSVSQLTKGTVNQLVPTAPTVASTGKIYFPGGIIMAWGTGSAPSGNSAITFGFTFGTFYNLQVTGSNASGSVGDVNLYVVGTPSTTGFTIRNSTGVTFTIYWFAIGKS